MSPNHAIIPCDQCLINMNTIIDKGIERHGINIMGSLTEKVINGQPSYLFLVTLHDPFGSVDCGRWWNKHGQHEAFIGHTTLHQYYSLVQLYHGLQISSQLFRVNKASIGEYDNGSSKSVSKGLKII